MDKDRIIAAVEKTGFPLEHRTAMAFMDSGWHVVSNKYYVDDNSDEVREIDLIAYKVGKVGDLRVYSAVVVSCKKSSENTWAFMTREIDPEDRNKDLTPLHFWTNDKALDYCLNRDGFSRRFAEHLTQKSEGIWGVPKREIFGFQELQPILPQKSVGKVNEPNSYKPANDKAIFSSITSLMKAQAYELGRLPNRRKEPSIYLFSLLTVLDGSMCEVSYDGSSPTVQDTQLQKYIAHYIIKGKEQYCRINFIDSRKLSHLIKEYDAAHVSTKKEIKQTIDDFYRSVFDSYRTTNVLSRILVSKIIMFVNIFGKFKDKHKLKDSDIDLVFNKKDKLLSIHISTDLPDEFVAKLNSNTVVLDITKKSLKSIYRYEGEFRFESGVPL